VIRVFVCEENSVQTIEVFTDGSQTAANLPAAQSGVDENARALCGDEYGVSGTATREYADSEDE
jgi:hypothetical protein